MTPRPSERYRNRLLLRGTWIASTSTLAIAFAAHGKPPTLTAAPPIRTELASAVGSSFPNWTHFAGGPRRVSIASSAPSPNGSPLKWQINKAPNGCTIDFNTLASPVIYGPVLVNTAEINGQWMALAIQVETGNILWSSPILPPASQSWSSPVIDTERGTVIVPNGPYLSAFSLTKGTPLWQACLDLNIVNASPVIARDVPGRDRLFITDYTFLDPDGKLYCINLDRYDPLTNPYRPGETIWCVTLGNTVGNSPAYDNGVVYVGCSTEFLGAGRLHAFPAYTNQTPEPIWISDNPKPYGFFGGVAVRTSTSGRHLFIASYNFTGGVLSSNLLKFDAADGDLIWEISSGRTSTTPVPLPDGRIALSTGVYGFGSAPSIQLFLDEGDRAQLLWDSALSTWTDSDNDGNLDPGEFFSIGGWTNQPVVFPRPGSMDLFAGILPSIGSSNGPYESLLRVNLNASPGTPGFIVQTYLNAGSSPAITSARLFSTGVNGLSSY
jgi:PQQ-like domain